MFTVRSWKTVIGQHLGNLTPEGSRRRAELECSERNSNGGYPAARLTPTFDGVSHCRATSTAALLMVPCGGVPMRVMFV
ncbi:hypothetical protein RUM44_004711 [Polyplax serrata]|uniref:Uncharacterized protein n=1 Tax=Polyplax serrata TaxID=468196 RepID=A0ABR1B3M1_POLSC